MNRNGFLRVQVDALRERGVRCDVLVAQGRRGPLAYVEIARWARALARGGRYDAVHAHYGLTGAAAAFQRSAPLVVTFHGSDVMGAVDAEGRLTPKGRFERILCGAVCRRAAATIAVSARLAAEIPCTGVRTIPVGVDESVFRPRDRDDDARRLGLDPRRRYVLFAADPERPVKRFWLARRAVEIVQESLEDVELIALGNRRLSEMPLWMNAADVLLITSSHEGGPLTHREAIACNLPVVSVDVGDVKAHLEGVDGCYVADGTAEALADALVSVLRRSRPDIRHHMLDTTVGTVARQIADVYEEVVRGRSAHPPKVGPRP